MDAAKILGSEGFEVFPYTTDDLVVGEKLLAAGCRVLMPWCAPIGSAMGPQNLPALKSMRAEFQGVPLIVDAGIGRPSHATAVMELGYDAVLLNTAVASAGDPADMAEAFAKAIEAGHIAHQAGMLEPRDMACHPPPHRKGGLRMKLDPFYLIVDSADWIERLVPLGSSWCSCG